MKRTWARCVARYRLQVCRLSSRVLAICSVVGAGLVRGSRFFGGGLRDGLVYALKSRLCFSGTTPVFAVSPSLDCCWAY